VYVYGEALSPDQLVTYYKNAPNADRDGDGIPDADDDFPDDRERAFLVSFPALSFGTLAFEDLWPGQGDYDFNDLVLDYRIETTTNALNLVRDIRLAFSIRAIGASLPSGFGFQFGNDKLKSSDIRVSGYNIQSDLYQIDANGTEARQAKPTIIVFDRAIRLLQSQGGSGVNTDPAFPFVSPFKINILVDIVSGQYTTEEIGVLNFNPFIIVNQDRGKEIHLPDHVPTSLASSALFGTGQDDSDASRSRYYKTSGNLPWALNLPQGFDYPVEKSQITSAYHLFGDWAVSGGKKYSDWYLDKAGYRDNMFIYKH
jgi:LruC domain-containing protein